MSDATTSGGDGHRDDHARRVRRRVVLAGLARGPGRGRADHALQRGDLCHANRGGDRRFRLSDYRPDAARWLDHSRTSQLALAAATMAVAHSGLDDAPPDRARFGDLPWLGRGTAGLRLASSTWSTARAARAASTRPGSRSLGLRSLHPTREAEQEPGGPAGHLAAVFGAEGPNATCQTACAASAQAIGEASELIRRGDADVMLAGGTHSMIHPLGLTGFILLTAMSTRNEDPARASRPFDRDRDGFVLGEGGGVLVLEELEHAKARGAAIHGEVAGHCSTADAFRLTDSHDEGRGAVAAMRGALTDAGVSPAQIGYINAHGTSTPSNDSIETLAIKRVFGDAAFRVPISSTKSMTGHLVSAGGAVEAIACLLAIRDGVLPPTINLENPRPGV